MEYCCPHNSTYKEVKAGRLKGARQSGHIASKAESAYEESRQVNRTAVPGGGYGMDVVGV